MSFEEINRWLDTAEKKKSMIQKDSKQLSKLRHTEKKREKREKYINRASVTCGTTSNCLINICTITVLERNREEKIYE